jgi:hypothetical protein
MFPKIYVNSNNIQEIIALFNNNSISYITKPIDNDEDNYVIVFVDDEIYKQAIILLIQNNILYTEE